MGEAEIDFPFRVSPSEQAIIENDPNPPCSIVLVGRSGTGKTTCAVFRMWARWLAFRHHSTEPFNQVSVVSQLAQSQPCKCLLTLSALCFVMCCQHNYAHVWQVVPFHLHQMSLQEHAGHGQ